MKKIFSAILAPLAIAYDIDKFPQLKTYWKPLVVIWLILAYPFALTAFMIGYAALGLLFCLISFMLGVKNPEFWNKIFYKPEEKEDETT